MIIHRLAAAFAVTSSPLASAFAPPLPSKIPPSLRVDSRMSYKNGAESEVERFERSNLAAPSRDPIIAAPEPVTVPSESDVVDWHRT